MYLLEMGFSVRGTSRTDAKGQWMKDMYRDRGHDKFDYVIVSDLLNVSATPHHTLLRRRTTHSTKLFATSSKYPLHLEADISAIIHTASPFHWDVEKPADFIDSAVAGTEWVLRAASKEPKVQRIVITSSYASIVENREPGTTVFTEADWNQQSIDEVDAKGADAWRMHWYRASKTLAERAAWKYIEDEKPS